MTRGNPESYRWRDQGRGPPCSDRRRALPSPSLARVLLGRLLFPQFPAVPPAHVAPAALGRPVLPADPTRSLLLVPLLAGPLGQPRRAPRQSRPRCGVHSAARPAFVKALRPPRGPLRGALLRRLSPPGGSGRLGELHSGSPCDRVRPPGAPLSTVRTNRGCGRRGCARPSVQGIGPGCPAGADPLGRDPWAEAVEG